jgi:cytochrome o ubiquinol oxidase subunit 2
MKRKSIFGFIMLLSLFASAFLGGCGTIALLEPKGPIGEGNRLVILVALALMLMVVIPVFIMHFLFARRYRASNTKAIYAPKWDYSGKIDLAIWLGPVMIVTGLAILSWSLTHRLDPYKPIGSGDPVRIEVVALDWKYLFIYPDQGIASMNQLVFPARVPLSFRLTSDTVMTSFFIPQLGSQIYAMAGMQTRLHLRADEPGTFDGHNQQFSGSGYSDMHFKATAMSLEEFEAWVQKTRQSPNKLDLSRFEEVAKPTMGYPVTYFSSVMPGLFEHIMRKYNPDWGKDPDAQSRNHVSAYEETGALEGH